VSFFVARLFTSYSSNSESSTEIPPSSDSSTKLEGCVGGAAGRTGLGGAGGTLGFTEGGGGGIRTPGAPLVGGTGGGGRALERIGGGGGARRTGTTDGIATGEGPLGCGAERGELPPDLAGRISLVSTLL
jgi:hypothetical protein